MINRISPPHPKLFSESYEFVYSFVKSDIHEIVLVYP